MIDLREENVDMLLEFKKDEPVASNNHEEPEKQRREHIEHREDDLDEDVLALN